MFGGCCFIYYILSVVQWFWNFDSCKCGFLIFHLFGSFYKFVIALVWCMRASDYIFCVILSRFEASFARNWLWKLSCQWGQSHPGCHHWWQTEGETGLGVPAHQEQFSPSPLQLPRLHNVNTLRNVFVRSCHILLYFPAIATWLTT